MMQATKPLARTGMRAWRTLTTGATTHLACTQPGGASDDAFEGTAVTAMLRHLGALRPKPSQHTGVWYPQDFEAHARTTGRALPRDFWTGFAAPAFFDKEQLHSFVVRDKQSASAALDAWFRGPTVAECGGAISAAQWRLVRDTLGVAKFDAVFGSTEHATPTMLRMRISGLVTAWEPLAWFVGWGPTALAGLAFDPAQARRGDVYYIRGVPHYGRKHPDGAGQGYNLLYAGDNTRGEPLFAGFDMFPARTEAEIRAYLVEAYNCPRSLRAQAYIKHSPCPSAYSFKSGDPAYELPEDGRYAAGFLAGAQRRMRFDRLIQARDMSAEALAGTMADALAEALETHMSARLGTETGRLG